MNMQTGATRRSNAFSLFGKELEWNRQYTLEMPKPSVIPREGRGEVQNLVARTVKCDTYNYEDVRGPDGMWLPTYWLELGDDDSDWEWIIKKGELAGTLPKRVSTRVYKDCGFKLPSQILSEIGNIARKYTVGSNSYRFDFDRKIDWSAGDFGDDDSCYWQSHAGAKEMIKNAGGFALRFFRTEKDDGYHPGIARCWIIPHPKREALILFNLYGMNGNTITVVRLLSEFLGVTYRGSKVRFENLGDYSNELYINGGSCWLVGPDSNEPYDTIDLRLPEVHVSEYTCASCGCEVDEDEAHSIDDGYLCDDCYSDQYASCEHCGEELYREDAWSDHDGNYYCNYHRDRLFTLCDVCEEWSRNDNFSHSIANGRYVCDDCFDEDYFVCDKCDQGYENDERQEVDGESWCESCAEDTFKCDGCGTLFPNDKLAKEVGGNTYCADCVPEEDDDEQSETAEVQPEAIQVPLFTECGVLSERAGVCADAER
jgi:formylmethanofuran dehydrogenase subunit E